MDRRLVNKSIMDQGPWEKVKQGWGGCSIRYSENITSLRKQRWKRNRKEKGEQWLNLDVFVNVELVGSSDGLAAGCKRKQGVRMTSSIGA